MVMEGVHIGDVAQEEMQVTKSRTWMSSAQGDAHFSEFNAPLETMHRSAHTRHPAPPAFQVGEQVGYDSSNYGRVIRAEVKSCIWSSADNEYLYELDCKSAAKASKLRKLQDVLPEQHPAENYMREVPFPTPGANAALGRDKLPPRLSTASNVSCSTINSPSRNSLAACESECKDFIQSSCLSPHRDFQVGDKVLYNSSSHKAELSAIVQKVIEAGNLYQLDVKNKAHVNNMRLVQVAGTEQQADAVLTTTYAPPTTTQMEAQQRMSVPPSQRPTTSLLPAREQGSLRTAVNEVEPAMVVNLGEPVVSSQAQGQSVVGTTPTPAKPRTSVRVAPPSPAVEAPATSVARASVCSTSTLGFCGAASPDSSPNCSPKHVRSDSSPVVHTPSQGGNEFVRPVTKFFMGTGVEKAKPASSPTSSPAAAAGQRISITGNVPSMPSQPSRQATSGLDGGDVTFGPGAFDPSHPHVRAQLVTHFQLSEACVIEEMSGFKGGLNQGVWFVKDASRLQQDYVLKLVRCNRIASNVLTEAENCAKLLREQKGIATDSHVSFPVKTFNCVDANGEKQHDLIVMKKVRGERLAEAIAHKWHAKQFDRVYQIMDKVGCALAEFHSRYGNAQHGDFQPANIFWDEERSAVSLIDIGGMGVPCMDNDIEHFQKALRLLAESYKSPELHNVGYRHFEQGYNRGQNRRPSQASQAPVQWTNQGR